MIWLTICRASASASIFSTAVVIFSSFSFVREKEVLAILHDLPPFVVVFYFYDSLSIDMSKIIDGVCLAYTPFILYQNYSYPYIFLPNFSIRICIIVCIGAKIYYF